MYSFVMRSGFERGRLCVPMTVVCIALAMAEAVGAETIQFAAAFATAQAQAETRLVNFGTPAARPHMLSGFGEDDRASGRTFSRSLGERSVIQFVIADSGSRQLVMAGTPLQHEGAPEQLLSLRLNGKPLARARLLRGPQKLKVELPAGLLQLGDNLLQIHYSVRGPEDVSPNSADPRELAVAWNWLQIVKSGRAAESRQPAIEPSADLTGDPPRIKLPAGTVVSYYARVRPGSKIVFSSIRDLDLAGKPTNTETGVVVYVETDEDGSLVEVVKGADTVSEPIAIPVETERIARIVFGRMTASSPGVLELAGAELQSPDSATSRKRPGFPSSNAGAGSGNEAADEKSPQALAALRSPGANVVVYVIDALRADALGAYGNELPTSPRFDQLAKQGILFGNALAVSSWTRPAVVSMFTGLRPSRHGVVGRDDGLAQEARTLAEILGNAGYRTGGFITNANVSAEFGVSQGFGVYEWFPHGKDKADQPPRSSVLAIDSALRWIEAGNREQPFLAFLHISDPHGPYLPPQLERETFASRVEDPKVGTGSYLRELAVFKIAQSERVRRDLEALYLAEVAYTDARLGDFLDGLERLGHADDTLIVVIADHGEEFFDHDWSEHGKTLYGEQIRVPLVMRMPGGALAGRRIDSPVQQIDLMPTLLDILGLEAPLLVDGRSSLRLLAQQSPRSTQPTFASLAIDGRRLVSVTEGNLKLIETFEYDHPMGHHPGLQLFDLAEDPGEKNNLSVQRPVAVGYLKMKISAAKHSERQGLTPETAVLDAELEQELRALGYLE